MKKYEQATTLGQEKKKAWLTCGPWLRIAGDIDARDRELVPADGTGGVASQLGPWQPDGQTGDGGPSD